MTETVSHTSLTSHSAPFSLAGGTYTANASGTFPDGTDAVELQRLVSGQWMQLDPPVKFTGIDKGGSRTVTVPAGTFRWLIPGAAHLVNTNVTHV